MKTYSFIALIFSIAIWFLCKSDADLVFPFVLGAFFISPVVAEMCGVLKKVKL